jgi:hypothetical protein
LPGGEEDLPEDVLEDLKESLEEVEREIERYSGRRGKQRYPSNADIAEVVKRLSAYALLDPQEFPDKVREELEKEGFYVGLVTDERIWRIYESLVRKGAIRDFLGVLG